MICFLVRSRMLTKVMVLDAIISRIEVSFSDEVSLKQRERMNRNKLAVKRILCTNLGDLKNARQLMNGFASYMNDDSEGLYLEGYYSVQMDNYIKFVQGAQSRFDRIVESINYLLENCSKELWVYQVTYDDLLKVRLDIDSLQVDVNGSFSSKMRACVEQNKPISIEIRDWDKNRIVYASSSLDIEKIDISKVLAK